MRGHNIPLPRHLFGYVAADQVLEGGGSKGVPAVWLGLSVEAGRGIGCHVLLENGALVADVPLGAVWIPTAHEKENPMWGRIREPTTSEWWDSPGDTAELVELPYLVGLKLDLLAPPRPAVGGWGRYLFTLDHLGDGYSRHPDQHKLLHAIAFAHGAVALVPNDKLLWHDRAFTTTTAASLDAPPRIKRQTGPSSIEGGYSFNDAMVKEDRRVPPGTVIMTGGKLPDLRKLDRQYIGKRDDLEHPPHGMIDPQPTAPPKEPEA